MEIVKNYNIDIENMCNKIRDILKSKNGKHIVEDLIHKIETTVESSRKWIPYELKGYIRGLLKDDPELSNGKSLNILSDGINDLIDYVDTTKLKDIPIVLNKIKTEIFK